MTTVRGTPPDSYDPLTGKADTGDYIPFTQYVLPRGERRPIKIHRPYAIQAKAKEIMALGYRFEAEVLTTGDVSLTITGKNTDIYHELCPNGPDVPEAVDRLVMKFDATVAKNIDEAAK